MRKEHTNREKKEALEAVKRRNGETLEQVAKELGVN